MPHNIPFHQLVPGESIAEFPHGLAALIPTFQHVNGIADIDNAKIQRHALLLPQFGIKKLHCRHVQDSITLPGQGFFRFHEALYIIFSSCVAGYVYFHPVFSFQCFQYCNLQIFSPYQKPKTQTATHNTHGIAPLIYTVFKFPVSKQVFLFCNLLILQSTQSFQKNLVLFVSIELMYMLI